MPDPHCPVGRPRSGRTPGSTPGRTSGRAAGSAFGPLEFQLVLLRRMADFQAVRVEAALTRLGVGRAEMREANRRWQAMIRSPRARGTLTRYRSVLGPPEAVVHRRIGDLDCEALTWPVPLWPDLRFEVLAAAGGAVWNEWLVRAPGAPPPPLRTLEDLEPWSCTVDEAARAFPPARPREGSAPTRWGLDLTVLDAAGERHAVTAEFCWGLLQRLPKTIPARDAGGVR
ncbi:hypothetical protein [Streptomyces sp. RKND-216]|uniref:hypothetical protein n=1 Tax=Streptomyces sp. RKND-216 TaxID=2562581 RepID=UPI001FF80F20|nr:hypothetical protein [Streptomyces sp. RKND-216]